MPTGREGPMWLAPLRRFLDHPLELTWSLASLLLLRLRMEISRRLELHFVLLAVRWSCKTAIIA